MSLKVVLYITKMEVLNMNFEKLQNAVEYAINYVVQRHFVPEEYMDQEAEVPFDVDTVLNCEYYFFGSVEDAKEFR